MVHTSNNRPTPETEGSNIPTDVATSALARVQSILAEAQSTLARHGAKAPIDHGSQTDNPSVAEILDHYWKTHSDHSPSAVQARRAGTLLLEWLASVHSHQETKAQHFSRPWQQEFIKWLGHDKNHAVATIRREMCIIAAAFNHAAKHVVVDDHLERREVQLLEHAKPILYGVNEISRLTSKPEPSPRDWLPTWEQMALFIDSIGVRTAAGEWGKNGENLFRFMVIILNTWARPQAILELRVSAQVDFNSGIIRLNPPGRQQTKKMRPEIPLTTNLRGWLERWNCDRPINRNGQAIKSMKKVFKAHAVGLGMPKFTPYTLRHFMATNIRRMEGCNVTREQRQEWLGHKRQDTTGWYEHFDPEWLREARIGTDKIIERLNGLLKIRTLVPVFSRASTNIANGSLNSKREVSKSS